MLPGPRGGLGIAEARGLRLLVDDGGQVVVERPGTEREVLVPAGRLRAVVVVPPDRAPGIREARRGLAGLLTDDGVVAVLPLESFGTGAGVASDRVLPQTTGLEALAGATGARFGAATDAEVAAVVAARRTALLRGSDHATGRPWGTMSALAASSVLAVLSYAADSPVAQALTALATVLLLPVVGGLVVRRRRMRRLVDSAPDLPGSTVLTTALGPEHGGLARATLTLSPEAVVLKDRLTETWVPGPALGGVVSCTWAPGAIALADADGQPLLVLDPAVWAGGDRERVNTPARAAGLSIDTSPVGPDARPSPHSLAMRDVAIEVDTTQADLGGRSLLVPPLATLAAWLLLGAALAGWARASWGVALVPFAVVAVVGCLDAWLQLHPWLRRQRARKDLR